MAFNWGGFTSGALGGAASGATLGSLLGPAGTATGGILGGLLGLLGGGAAGGLTGSKGEFKKSPNKFNTQQQQALNALLSRGQQKLQNPLQGFNDVENYAQRKFNTDIVPGLAERFSSMGSGGSQRSSAFQGALGSAGSDLSAHLAALRHQYGLENEKSGLDMLNYGLTPQEEMYYQSAEQGVGPQLLTAGAGAASNYFGNQLFSNSTPNPQLTNTQLAQILQLLRNR